MKNLFYNAMICVAMGVFIIGCGQKAGQATATESADTVDTAAVPVEQMAEEVDSVVSQVGDVDEAPAPAPSDDDATISYIKQHFKDMQLSQHASKIIERELDDPKAEEEGVNEYYDDLFYYLSEDSPKMRIKNVTLNGSDKAVVEVYPYGTAFTWQFFYLIKENGKWWIDNLTTADGSKMRD